MRGIRRKWWSWGLDKKIADLQLPIFSLGGYEVRRAAYELLAFFEAHRSWGTAATRLFPL
jgi:hypothetical protein